MHASVCPGNRLLIVWSCMSIHLLAPLSLAKNFILRVFCSDTSFWNVLFCPTVWRLSGSICQKHPRWSDNKLHANSHASPLHEKKNPPFSNKAYRPIPRELALHVFDKWTYTSPSISSSGKEGASLLPSVSLYIKSTNQGVSVMHPSSRLTSWQLRCKSGSFIPMTLCQYLYGGSRTSLPFCSYSVETDSQADREGERWASDRAELKALTVSLRMRGVWLASLKCDW